MKKSILLLTFLIAAIAGEAKDLKAVVLTTTPQMHCESCENRIKNNMRFERGVKKIETNIAEQTVTITYDAEKTSVEKILDGFKKFKYTARPLKKGEKIKRNENEECPLM